MSGIDSNFPTAPVIAGGSEQATQAAFKPEIDMEAAMKEFLKGAEDMSDEQRVEYAKEKNAYLRNLLG